MELHSLHHDAATSSGHKQCASDVQPLTDRPLGPLGLQDSAGATQSAGVEVESAAGAVRGDEGAGEKDDTETTSESSTKTEATAFLSAPDPACDPRGEWLAPPLGYPTLPRFNFHTAQSCTCYDGGHLIVPMHVCITMPHLLLITLMAKWNIYTLTALLLGCLYPSCVHPITGRVSSALSEIRHCSEISKCALRR